MAEHRMRVAVAGTNALALMIAAFVVRDTSHQIIVLSRSPQPQLSSQGYAVLVVDYTDQNSLQHAVKGVQTIISTVTGEAQLELLKAAVAQGVRRFAPAEFEGPPDQQALSDLPIEQDPLDRGKRNIRAWLIHYGNRIESTVFVCGVLYERFAPGGLHSYRLGCATDVGAEGDFIINVRNLRATAPLHNQNNEHVTLCLTAAQDVARLVVRSLDMRTWPRELVMVGEKLTVTELLQICLRVRGRTSLNSFTIYTAANLISELQEALSTADRPREIRVREHIATVARRYVYHRPRNPQFPMLRFEDWLRHNWTGIPVDDDDDDDDDDEDDDDS